MQGLMAKNDGNQRQDQGFGTGAAQLASDDPWLQIAGDDLDRFRQMLAQERIEIVTYL